MSIIQGSSIPSAAGGVVPFDTTVIPNSVWIDGTADFLSAELGAKTRTKAVIGTWFQKTGFTTGDATIFSKKGTAQFAMRMQDQASKQGLISIFDFDGGDFQYSAESPAGGMVLRDIGWYHIMISIDTTASAGSRLRYFINGIDRTDTLRIDVDYTLNDNLSITGGSGEPTQWGVGPGGSSQFSPIYLAQSFMLDDDSIQNNDVAVTDILDSFTYGTNGSQFAPKANSDIASLASSAGGDSFCLDYANSSDLGNDISSQGNDFSPTSMAAANQSSNTPSLVYPIFNPLAQAGTATGTLSEGNTKLVLASDNGVTATLTLPSTGLYYWEMDWTSGANGIYPGVCVQSAVGSTGGSPHSRTDTWVWLAGDGSGRAFNGSSLVSYVGSATSVGKIAVCFDSDNTAMYFGTISSSTITWLNSGNPTSGSSKTGAAPFTSLPTDETIFIYQSTGGASTNQYLFDEDEWTGVTNRPAAALALNSLNTPAPEFQGKDFFDATIYEGNGTSQRVGDFVPFTDAFNVAKSAMFQHDDARALKRTAGTPSSSGGKKGTWSVWYKTSVIDTDNVLFDTGTTATNRFSLQMDTSGQITFVHGSATILKTNADLKGGGFWRNLVLRVDTSLGTAADRALMYIDGVLVTSFATDGRASLGQNSEVGFMDSGATQFVGSFNGVSANQWDGYFAETVFLDNQFLSASSFGQLDTSTNKWVPKAVTGLTFGNQGFYLAYGGNFGTSNGAGDSTGNSNNLTEIGTWATTDQFIDTPTKNFATLDTDNNQSNVLTNGGTRLSPGGSGWKSTSATFKGLTSGKFYFEFTPETANSNIAIGIGSPPFVTTGGTLPGSNFNEYSYYFANGEIFNNGVFTAYGSSGVAAGVVVGVAIDLDNNKIFFAKNNTFEDSGNPVTGANAAFTITSNISYDIVIGMTNSVTTANNIINFGGQAALAFTPPTGFVSFNQDDLDDTEDKLTALAWIKNRDAADNHMLFDKVRGVGNDMHPNSSVVEAFNANTVQRFYQRGVQVGSNVEVNTANESYVLWQWANDGTRTANNNGAKNIFETVSSAGHFAIFDWVGNSTAGAFQHSMGGAIEMLIVKRRNVAGFNWYVWHKALADTQALLLDVTGGINTSTYWNNVAVNAVNQFTLGATEGINKTGDDIISYAFRSVPGVCHVNSYVGNGAASGPYVFTGFSSRYLLIKKVGTGSWFIYDTARSPVNEVDDQLLADDPAAETTGSEELDILADGFKIKTSDSGLNTSGSTYIYLAIADISGNGTLPPIYGR